jgi:FlaG/FlaF family flagellin (archaellin)
MNANELYKNLGIAVIVIIAIAVVLKGFNYQKKIVEGLTSSNSPTGDAKITSTLAIIEKLIAAEDTAAEKSDDGTLSTEDFLADFEELISIEIIYILRGMSDKILNMEIPPTTSTVETDDSKAAWIIIERLNDLNKLRGTLADASKSWDDMKGNVSDGGTGITSSTSSSMAAASAKASDLSESAKSEASALSSKASSLKFW